MALLDRLKQKKTPASKTDATVNAPVAKKSRTSKKVSTKEVSASASQVRSGVARAQAFTLLRPHVSEKAAQVAEKGIYIFDVPVTANKIEIRKAVESVYRVKVARVRTIRGIGKVVRRASGGTGHRNRWKKALVELHKGQTISMVEGV